MIYKLINDYVGYLNKSSFKCNIQSSYLPKSNFKFNSQSSNPKASKVQCYVKT